MSTDKKHSIDKLFHESLNGQKIEPSIGVWNSLSSNIPARRGSRTIYYLMAASAALLISLMIFTRMFGLFETETLPVVEKDTPNNVTETIKSASAETNITDENQLIQIEEAGETALMKPGVINEPLAKQGIIADQAVEMRENKMIIDTRIQEDQADDMIDRLSYLYLSSLSGDPILSDSESDTDKSLEAVKEASPRYNLDLEDAYVKSPDLLFGAGFSPAVNIYPDGQNRNDLSFELIAAYEKSRFFIEGGIGANYATESVEYGVSYSSYDSVGYYVNIDAFTIYPEKPDSIVFETSFKNIYDSINYFRIEENTNKYAYLQIPVRFGYRVLDNGRFSLDLKAGVIFSWQIFKDVPDVPYGGSDSEQIEVIRQYPDRLNINWQYTAALGMNYHINKQLRFTLEPFYRQYIKSVYSTDSEYSARSPYAFGIRGGIYIQF